MEEREKMIAAQILVIVLLNCCFIGLQAEPQLLLSSVVFRHGDRSPIVTYPKDQYHESDWPQGFGQLSIAGMQQEEQLGGLLRARYVTDTYPNFLHPNYTRVQVNVRSTDMDRTLMSASAMLSALYPPDNSQRFNDSIAWQPIPIHTMAKENDHMLRGHRNCPAYSKLKDADKTTVEYQRIVAENEGFFVTLQGHTGLEAVNMSNIRSIKDSVFAENVTEGKQSPSWATTEIMTKLAELTDYIMGLFFNSKEKNRLTAGVWLGKLLGDMQSVANKSDTTSKLFLYSAHDTTVACMMSALGLFDGKQPPYATAFLVELYFNPNSGLHYIQFSLRLGPDGVTFNILEVPESSHCANRYYCTMEEFKTFVTPLIPSDIEQECSVSSPSQSSGSLGITFTTGGGCIGDCDCPANLPWWIEKQTVSLRHI
ncbi:lysosomal acid phosphatase-like isoform X3 [Halichondria panicea]|uniref:lysosomal acid phosphatase-like isoform X3 n=1 Tax=Halichondria panicea TaxID=6063 RepID=UPI00312B53F3